MTTPAGYVLPTDQQIEEATRAGVAHLRSLRGDDAARSSNGGGASVDQGWEPFVDLFQLDASQQIPELTLPFVGWAGRLTIMSAEPKAGKTTFLAQAIAAALNEEPFVGLTVRPPESVAIATEEPLSLVAARLRAAGLESPQHDNRVWICPPREGIPRIRAAVGRQRPTIFIVDSLTEWAYQSRTDTMNDALAMRGLVADLREIADQGTSVHLVHHGRKADGNLRDSVDLAAAPDLLVNFEAVNVDGDPVHFKTTKFRHLSAIGRWPVDDLRVTFDSVKSRYILP